VLRAAIEAGILHAESAPIAAFLDWERVEANVRHLRESFPAHLDITHAFAVKANASVPVVARLGELGMGAEVASAGELAVAVAAGIDPKLIVFDSPAKSYPELCSALSLGVTINIDNFQEFARISEIRQQEPSTSAIGIRLNPQLGSGTIAAMSTATRHSKFGIPVGDPEDFTQLADLCAAHPWITTAHVHVGSQGCTHELMASGVARLIEFADAVNERAGFQQITTLDIGGGLPVDFETDEPLSAYAAYVSALQEHAPRLLSGEFRVITEFGRSILAKHGFIAAYVEYTKEVGGRQVAITHAGAHVATRTVFMPEAWPIRIQAFDAAGRVKPQTVSAVQDVAGPCCFAGDLVARGRELPLLEQGDLVALLDTGAYYTSTPFSYNSLPEPGIYGIESFDPTVQFGTIREPEALDLGITAPSPGAA